MVSSKTKQTAHIETAVVLPLQTMHLHIGGDLHIPVRDNRFAHPSREEQQQQEARSSDPFEGLPLRAWAEKLGERVMPAYELIKEEQAAAKIAAKSMGKQVQEVYLPKIPHVLPFTKWCAPSALYHTLQDCFSLSFRVR